MGDGGEPTDESGLLPAPSRARARAQRASPRTLGLALGLCACALGACALGAAARALFAPARRPTVLVVGAGIAGLAAARELERLGWDVTVLEARDRIGGRVHSEWRRAPDGRPWVFEHGASWLHGAGTNPAWQLVREHGLLSTQWLPRTFHVRSALSATPLELAPSAAAPDEPVGEAMRDAFVAHAQRRARFVELLDAAAEDVEGAPPPVAPPRARAPPVDVPLAALLEQFASERQLTPRELELFALFVGAYGALDEGEDLARVGLGAWVWRSWGDDRELMAGAQGMAAIPAFLARALRRGVASVVLRARVSRIEYGRAGVRAVTDDGRAWHGAACVLTLPLGVLQHGDVAFAPPLPAWKVRAIGEYAMGALDKAALLWNASWWPTKADAFWRAPEPRRRAATAAAPRRALVEWYSLAGLHAGRSASDGPHPAVLLATPVGAWARELGALSDARVLALLLADLRATFPTTRVPPPADFVRTRWVSDPFARGGYSHAPVGADLLTPSLLAEPVGNVLFLSLIHI